MNKNTILFAVAGLLLLGGIGFIVMQNKPTPTDSLSQNGTGTTIPDETQKTEGTDSAASGDDTAEKTETPGTDKVVEVSLEASPFKFSQSEIKVKKGDTVKVTVKNVQGTHDWKLEGYDEVGIKQLKAGESETVEFVADKTGTFEYYCSVGNHRAQGMVGNLIVEE